MKSSFSKLIPTWLTLESNFPKLYWIEDARHHRHRIWGSAGCDSFCKLWWVNGRGCVGTVVYLYGSWRFLAIPLQILDSFFWRFCGASGTRNGCKKRCQGSLKSIQIWHWKNPTIIKNQTSGLFGGSWEHSVSWTQRGARIRMNSGAILVLLARFCVPFWRPLDFEGPIRLVFLDVFGATAKTENNTIFWEVYR